MTKKKTDEEKIIAEVRKEQQKEAKKAMKLKQRRVRSIEM